jgi:monothiol glutaredoxin
MPRSTLPEQKIHAAIREKVAGNFADTVAEVQAAVSTHDVVVVGMAQNPHVRRARKMLSERNTPFHYLEYGSYIGEWRRRTAIKMWSGWPTFPMVFHKGILIGGADDLAKYIAAGELGA